MLSIEAIPAFSDNYIWLLHCSESQQAFVVDPGDASPVLEALKINQLKLKGILITHWHPDHTGGIEDLQRSFENSLRVIGPHSENIQGLTEYVCESSKAKNILGYDFDIWEIPGHTLDHICYVNQELATVFCGDTLFLAGCGRMFEGNALQMHASLQRFKLLRDETQVYCAHEYSLSNLQFAHAAEPQNNDIQDALERIHNMRNNELITLPSNIAQEKRINPFLRARDAEDFLRLRSWKDDF